MTLCVESKNIGYGFDLRVECLTPKPYFRFDLNNIYSYNSLHIQLTGFIVQDLVKPISL